MKRCRTERDRTGGMMENDVGRRRKGKLSRSLENDIFENIAYSVYISWMSFLLIVLLLEKQSCFPPPT